MSVFRIFLFTLFAHRIAATVTGEPAKPISSPKPCTIKSPSTGIFYDLNSMSAPTVPTKLRGKTELEQPHSWISRGFDYPSNFSINFCAPVIEPVKNVVGVDRDEWANVAALYEADGRVNSLGSVNTNPIFRGRKLVLTYSNGSPCPDVPFSSSPRSRSTRQPDGRKGVQAEVEHGDGGRPSGDPSNPHRRKSAVISFLCDRDSMAPTVSVAFVGTVDECSYFFEARSIYACGGIEVEEQPLSPGGIFGVMALIAVAVYFVGGCFFRRTVLHYRGWQQIPNYDPAFWAKVSRAVSGVFIFFRSLFTRSRKLSSQNRDRACLTDRRSPNNSPFMFHGLEEESNYSLTPG